MTDSLHILLVDDNPDDRALVLRQLERDFSEVRVTQIADEAAFTKALDSGGFDLVITDYQLQWTDGLAVLRRVKERCSQSPRCPVILFTATGNESVAVEAMKAGLDDYVVKAPQHYVRLRAAVRAALERLEASRRAAETLRRSEERYRLLFNAANDPIFVFVLTEEGLPGLVVDVNDRGCDLLGYTREEILGMSPLEVRAPEEQVDAQADMERLRRAKHLFVERTAVAKGGRRLPLEVSLTLFDLDGRPTVIAVLRDVSERKRTEEALRAYSKRLAALSRRLLEVQEDERRRIARELHDQVGQILTAIGIRLQTARKHVDPASQAALDECAALVVGAMGQVRDISLDLRPSLLDDLGLEAAIRWYTDKEGRSAGLEIDFRSGLAGARLPPDLETVCFRLVQEALTNVFRHARAKRARIELRREGRDVVLSVADDGAGFDVEEIRRRGPPGSSLGLIGMEERVTIAGGRLEIESRPSSGSVVRARFPLS